METIKQRGWEAAKVIGTAAFCQCLLGASAGAQTEWGYIMQTGPYPVYAPLLPDRYDYNLKWGDLTARLEAGLQLEYNDNLYLAHNNRKGGFCLVPGIGTGFMLPVGDNSLIQLDLGVGYRWYFNEGSLNALYISSALTPLSRVDFRVVYDELQLDFYDRFSLQIDPVSQPEISGSADQASEFKEFYNSTGFIADYRPMKDFGLLGGFDYALTRSLTSFYNFHDNDQYTFSLGTYFMPDPRFTLGLMGNYKLTYYLRDFQNNSTAFSIGPFINWDITRFITLHGFGGYTKWDFDTGGQIGDSSDYSGNVWEVGVRHRINRVMNQDIRAGHEVTLAYWSNYLQTWNIQYEFNWRVARGVSIDLSATYQDYETSSAQDDSGKRILAYIGTGFQLSKQWSMALAYAFAWKNADDPDLEYTQNRITLDLRRKF